MNVSRIWKRLHVELYLLYIIPATDTVRDAISCSQLYDQDPYPERKYCTGLAFSIPEELGGEFPPTLLSILKEYSSDLRLPIPSYGSLERWAKAGVLLWNAVPSCGTGKSLSHDWTEWSYLTSEIIQSLSQRGIVFVFLGSVAKRYMDLVSPLNNEILQTSHPSPRGSLNSKTPFVGSRLFSTINDKLISNGLDPIDWRLQ